jgi:CheY-like chemotaxis protein
MSPRPVRKMTVESTSMPAGGGELSVSTPSHLPSVAAIASSLPLEVDVYNETADDRDRIQPGDRVALIVDNDVSFARFLLETVREKGFKGVVALRGAAAITLAREYMPDAITLDIRLPDIDGWRVLERLKSSPIIRHIPVHIITTEDETHRALQGGAIGVLSKPIPSKEVLERTIDDIVMYIDRDVRNVLVVEADDSRRAEIVELLREPGMHPLVATTAREARDLFRDRLVDCIVVNPRVPDLAVDEFLEEVCHDASTTGTPVLIYAPDEAADNYDDAIKQISPHIYVRQVRSLERLLDQATLCLHVNPARLSESKRAIWEKLHSSAHVLAHKKVLIVDDDIRNIFALTSVLERESMDVIPAETGRDAIDILRRTPNIDIVLMDIMMPEMDGNDTMRAIRMIPEFQKLPIIAITAKAMKGDREKCIEAGAWDYLSKPVDTDQMLTVLRSWLHR